MVYRATLLMLAGCLLLAGCSTPVSNPFPDAIAISATDDPLVPADSRQVGGESSVVYQVDLSTVNGDLVYFELDQPLDLTVYYSSAVAYASSHSADGFAAGLDGLSPAAAMVAPQAIGVDVICRGSCVISDDLSGTVYVEVENHNVSASNIDLYVFGDAYADLGEPDNDAAATATTLLTSDEGAIETLGDADYYRVPADGTLSFTTGPTALPIRATIQGTSLSIVDGESMPVAANNVIRVDVDGGDRAAASGVSDYTLTFTAGPVVPFPDAQAVTANLDPVTAVTSTTIGADETLTYEVDLTPASASDLVYLELNADLELNVYRGDGSLYATSYAASGFQRPLAITSAPQAGLLPQDIGVEITCRGSCVLADDLGDSAYVEVHNPGTATSFDLFAYGDQYQDSGEPTNDTETGAVSVSSGTPGSGAIETLGDVDYYEVTTDATVVFTVNAASTLPIHASVVGTAIDLTDGQDYDAFPGDIIMVHVPDGSEAGASAVSGYTLNYVIE